MDHHMRHTETSCCPSERLQAVYDAAGGNVPELKAAACRGYSTTINLSASTYIYSEGGEPQLQPQNTVQRLYSSFPLCSCMFVEYLTGRCLIEPCCVQRGSKRDSSEDSSRGLDVTPPRWTKRTPRSVNESVRRS